MILVLKRTYLNFKNEYWENSNIQLKFTLFSSELNSDHIVEIDDAFLEQHLKEESHEENFLPHKVQKNVWMI